MNLDLEPDVVDPADEDWASKDDAEVWHSARAGVPEAIEEAHRRGITF